MNMKMVRSVLYSAFFLLCSCANNSFFQDKTVLNTCVATCEHRANLCATSCQNNCQNCLASARESTVSGYKHYIHEQCVRGGIITRQLKSYRDPLQCRKITCNCPADYQVCMQSCGGVIHKQLRVASVCQ